MCKTKLLDTKQAAKYLGVAEQTMCNWRFLGHKGPAYICIGRRRLYRDEDLDVFIEKNRIEPEAS
jgi:hypothetical protein